MKKFGVVLALAAALLSGCAKKGKLVIGVVPKGQAHIFWQSVHAGAAAAARELGVEIRWNGPAMENEYSRQVQIVDSMINARVDGLVLAPTDQVALVSVVERAARENIPVTIFDSGINTENYVSFVATNNYGAGQMAARRIGQILGGQGNVAMMMNMPGSASTLEREKGFAEALAREFPGVRIVERQFGMSDRAKAMSVAEDILTAHPEINGIFASNEPSSVGAAQALKSRQLAGKIKLVGFDSSPTLVDDLKAGVFDSLVVQDPFNIGYTAVKTVVAKLKGETPAKKIDSPARVLTAADLDKPEVERLLNPELDKYLK
ncbi:MAG: substrate-binding domain-containing protein [Acidobacteria bacterium]|nr:substrate-binding domain-containing protein [Acidobacteriota bacterium]